ncbi:hypothetical protein PRIPAC_82314 [Pristionchus pacificus]|uniref:Methyltransferase n=1 Tax=Pristionchus pacificus TaxID=54126 RepID=A0A2A6CMH0_PRIPA|nr:hypothetical protein PRIPAC_82314 [Pristionchus pacificus]|eukprot:PDM79290.1 methyltransferase [Pristionchus pacificus]
MTELQKRLKSIHFGALIAPVIALGKKLGLFDALSALGSEEAPTDARAVAQQADCKERYVKEWLSALACARLIEITPDERFWMSEEAKHEFDGLNNFEVARMLFVPASVKVFDDLVDAFKVDGRLGLDYSQFADFYNEQDVQTRAKHEKHLVKDYFPLIGMNSVLSTGGRVLDVGCGTGFHSMKIATAFPHCSVDGVDISDAAVSIARTNADEEKIDNIIFRIADAGELPADWTNTFDFVTIFDACHDQLRPDMCLAEIYRVLKPGGVFAMLEMRGTSSVFDDCHNLPHAAHVYASSLFHCLPVGSNRGDALCMGAMWGEQRARTLIEQAGFNKEHVQVLHPAFFPINDVYLCRK